LDNSNLIDIAIKVGIDVEPLRDNDTCATRDILDLEIGVGGHCCTFRTAKLSLK
jgi:hypothetical protein